MGWFSTLPAVTMAFGEDEIPGPSHRELATRANGFLTHSDAVDPEDIRTRGCSTILREKHQPEDGNCIVLVHC